MRIDRQERHDVRGDVVILRRPGEALGNLLPSTGTRAIVEDTRRDSFRGAVPGADGSLRGESAPALAHDARLALS